ncbi:hypothetical protein [Streptomyces sp. NPDC056663]|uniref:hypothetical protein n=1 Tax=Streptomyces sp. NPDC056663 TaxID=3345899 RepID=UPI0036A4E930
MYDEHEINDLAEVLDDDGKAPRGMIDAGENLAKAVRNSTASPGDAHLKHDVFYAREKLALEVSGWAHWDTEAGHELKDAVFSEVHELTSGRGSFEALDAALQALYDHVNSGE